MAKTSPQTKSFIFLIAIIAIGSFICVNIYLGMLPKNKSQQQKTGNGELTIVYKNSNNLVKTAEAMEAIDTSQWNIYTSDKYGFSFKYSPDWQVLQEKTTKDGFNLIEIDPGQKFYNIQIYISKTGYYVMDGLPTIEDSINGVTALNVNNMLYGIKKGDYYFTFDENKSLSNKPAFNALVRSVQFR
jgi:hypothetical protein